MAKTPIDDATFQYLLDRINQETSCNERKFENLYYSKGCFSGYQAATLINAYKSCPEKVKVIKALEPRLCRMTCAEAKEILLSFPITDNDRLVALDCVKRCLIDHSTMAGMEYILSAYEYERDKMKALSILQTVSQFVADRLSAGGHQGYAALGGLYTQNWPLHAHLYGPIEDQMKRMPGQGEPAIAPQARPGKLPSLYTSHTSYGLPPDKGYDEVRGYYGARGFPEQPNPTAIYPAGAPPLGYHTGAPSPTGYQGLKPDAS